MQVVGRQGVSLPDISSARVNTSGDYWAIDNVIFNYLTQGDTINLNTMQVIYRYRTALEFFLNASLNMPIILSKHSFQFFSAAFIDKSSYFIRATTPVLVFKAIGRSFYKT